MAQFSFAILLTNEQQFEKVGCEQRARQSRCLPSGAAGSPRRCQKQAVRDTQNLAEMATNQLKSKYLKLKAYLILIDAEYKPT